MVPMQRSVEWRRANAAFRGMAWGQCSVPWNGMGPMQHSVEWRGANAAFRGIAWNQCALCASPGTFCMLSLHSISVRLLLLPFCRQEKLWPWHHVTCPSPCHTTLEAWNKGSIPALPCSKYPAPGTLELSLSRPAIAPVYSKPLWECFR